MNRKISFIITTCLLCFSLVQARTDYNINAGSVTISTNGEYRIYGDGTPTADTIKVNPGIVADIILENVNIDVSDTRYACAFDMSGANVTLRLSGVNSLHSGHYAAGLHVPEDATLTITSVSGAGSTADTLNATGGGNYLGAGAGIGGASFGSDGGDGSGGTITILGGAITASGGGSGIGGGWYYGSGGNITISGGTIIATGGEGSSGIGGNNNDYGYTGGGYPASGGNITLSGGTVVATGGYYVDLDDHIYGVDIGGGYQYGEQGDSGSISISGGTVIATSYGIGIATCGTTETIITNTPVIFADTINGYASNPANGIATGSNRVTINDTTKIITLNTHFTVPEAATLTIPEEWTLHVTDGTLLTNHGSIVNNGTLTNSSAIISSGISANSIDYQRLKK